MITVKNPYLNPKESESLHYLLRHQAPKMIAIDFDKLLKPKMPGDDAQSIVQTDEARLTQMYLERRYHDRQCSGALIPLPPSMENSLMVVCNIPGNSVFEIDLEAISNNDAERAIAFKGYAKRLLPKFSFNQN